MNSDPIVVFMTAASAEEAGQLADMLIESKLAACVQVLPKMESVYRWQGRIERSSEVLLIAKTELNKFAELERRVTEIHSYDTPEIVAVPIAGIAAPYRKWLGASLDPDTPD